jgi:uncharacterized protein (DUF2141 family)
MEILFNATGTYTLKFVSVSSNGGAGPSDGGNFLDAISVTCPSSICGMKFNDLNSNGVQDGNETGLSGWTINLTYNDASGTPVTLTTTTDAKGGYCFNNLPAGTYTLSETQQSGWLRTYPAAAPGTHTIALTVNQHSIGNNFGNTQSGKPGSICGMKFNDLNNNGVNDSEPGLSGWIISLTYNPGTGPVTLTTVTGADGKYCFNNLPAGGPYTVSEIQQGGWIQTSPTGTGIRTVTLIASQNSIGNDFGNRQSTDLGSICGMKFNDLNGNGSMDSGETGLPNWTIKLTGPTTSTAVTDKGGNYCFTNLKPGTYTLAEVNQSDWIQTYPGSPGTYTVILSAGQNVIDRNFGNMLAPKFGSICGMKFNDLNGNGRKDEGESGIGDWQINLGGPIDLSIRTNKDGTYCFDNLKPGEYIIKEEMQPGWVQMIPASGSYAVTLTFGQIINDINFGNRIAPVTGCVEPPKGMVAWWPLDETSVSKEGSISNDLAGFNNVGTRVNGPAPVAAKVLGGLQFDGINDYVEVPDHPEINFGKGDFSFDAWIATSNNKGVQIIIDKRIAQPGLFGGYVGYAVFLQGGKLSLQMADGTLFYSYTNYTSPVFVANGQLNHIAVTVARTNHQGIIFYLNGVPTQIGDPTIHPSSLDNISPLRIGAESLSDYAGISTFKGVMDEIELFSRVITKEEINSIYKAGSAGKCKPAPLGSICGMKFNDVNGNGVIDARGAGEPGLSNWTINLTGPVNQTTTTDANGYYCFNNLPAGTYIVSEVNKDGWLQKAPAAPGIYTVTLKPGQKVDNQNFGNIYAPTSDCVTPPSGMVGWWPGDGNANDISGNNNNGTVNGGLSFVNGKVAQAFKVFNETDNITVPDNASLNFGRGNFSIDAWVNTNDRGDIPSNYDLEIVNKMVRSNDINNMTALGYDFIIHQGSLILMMAQGTTGQRYSTTNVNLADGKWHFVVVTVDRVNSTGGKLYVDGNVALTFDPTAGSNSITNTSPLIIAGHNIGYVGPYNWVDQVDEVELFNRVITPDEILSIYKAGSSGKCKYGSICGVKFNDLNGNGVQDKDEPGIPEWQINLGGTAEMSVRTDKDGRYCFDNLKPGEYMISEAMLAGWMQISPAARYYTVKLTTGQHINDFNFGNKKIETETEFRIQGNPGFLNG